MQGHAENRMFRALLESAEQERARRARAPRRIRLNLFVPIGKILAVPVEENGKPAILRRLGDGGPYDLLIHPKDWQAVAEAALKGLEPQWREEGATEEEIARKRALALAKPESWRIRGIQVCSR